MSSQSLRTNLQRWIEIQIRIWPLGFRRSLVPEAGRRVWSRTESFAFFGSVWADGPAFLKCARAGMRTWHGGSSHAAHVRRPIDDSPHPVGTQTSRSTISVGSIATVIGHQHHCAASKSRAARLMSAACRLGLFDARRFACRPRNARSQRAVFPAKIVVTEKPRRKIEQF
jgi:hypothetical protein